MRTGHAEVALKRRLPRQDLFVGRRHMGVSTQHRRDATVEDSAHQLHVAGGFGVEIHQDHSDVGGQLGQHAVDRFEGAIDRSHEDATEQAEHGHRDVPLAASSTLNVRPGALAG